MAGRHNRKLVLHKHVTVYNFTLRRIFCGWEVAMNDDDSQQEIKCWSFITVGDALSFMLAHERDL